MKLKRSDITCLCVTGLIVLVLAVTFFMDVSTVAWLSIAAIAFVVGLTMLILGIKRKRRSTAVISAILSAGILLMPVKTAKAQSEPVPGPKNILIICGIVILGAVGIYVVYKCARHVNNMNPLPPPPGPPPPLITTNFPPGQTNTVNWNPPPYLLPGTNYHPAWSNYMGSGGEFTGVWIIVPNKKGWLRNKLDLKSSTDSVVRLSTDRFWVGPFLASNTVPITSVEAFTNSAAPGTSYTVSSLWLQGSTDLVNWTPYVAETWLYPDGSMVNKLSWSNLTISVNYVGPTDPPPSPTDDYEIDTPIGVVDKFYLRQAPQ